jgi:hypothetical protein
MPFSKEFTFNPNTDYILKYNNDKFKLNKFAVFVNQKDYFIANIINIFTNYSLTFTNEDELNKWKSKCDMKYWQNQLNFAVYCATYGCGVSLYDHLVNPMIPTLAQSFFMFHFLYQTRKILSEMKCPIPTNQNFNSYSNFIDLTEYTKICNEFNIDSNDDFRIKIEPNNGAGYMYDENNKKTSQQYDSNNYSFEHPSGYIGHQLFGGTTYGNRTWGAGNFGGTWINHVNKIAQDIDDGWNRFILQKSIGFTRAGIERLNDSIRTYVYCILGAQVQARTAIIGQIGTSPDAQKQFIKNFEDAIYANLSIPDSIDRYQNAINNSHSKLDFAIGSGLYMIPSNLVMQIGSLDNYNNNILIATDNMDFGINNINNKSLPLMSIPNNNDFKTPELNKKPEINNVINKNENNIINKNESIYKDYHETKYILPFIIGGSIGLLIYFIK